MIMASDTLRQIENINKSLRWVKAHRPDVFEQRFLQLVEERRKLRKIARAAEDNPAIAAYGKSQVGKSYLMSNMLQQEVTLPDGRKTIKPFEVVADGRRYNFIDEMNPITKDTEATGVVTRFSSFSRLPERYSEQYPILMKSLSVTDMTLILCDGYFNDVQNYTTGGRAEINERAEALYEKYKNCSPLSITPITADDLLEMKFYFNKYINNAQEFNHSDFFTRLALVINRIPVDDYVDVFSYLWHSEPNLTQLYKRLINILSRLSFHSDVYLNVDAVLHEGENENTIMSVQCLDGLCDPANRIMCDAHLRLADGSYQKVTIQKSELSAVCAEVVYRIGEEFLESTASYDMSHITDPNVRSQLTQGPVKLDLLKHTDLLDFPGARSRKKEQSETLQQPKILTTVLLRGKVSYLFNKYSESKAVNILLYCHDYMQNDVSNLYITLNEWVNQYVGQTPEDRARTLQLTGGISPLFYVATKFNADMAEDQNPKANERIAIDGRWQGRFKKVLYKECFNADSVEWVKNWTAPGQYFQNSYLLRDYKYSGTKGSKLYDGFRETGKEQVQLVSDEYMQRLRESFCESEDAGLFFGNRELAWDVTATMNNDGALYIIENLTRVAAAMGKTRETKFSEDVIQVAARVLAIMKEHYVSDDTAELLKENVSKAVVIFRQLEVTFDSKPEYFGHLLEALQVTATESYNRLHKLIPTLASTVNDTSAIKDYELIRQRCKMFEGCSSEADKWQRIIQVYHFTDQEEAAEFLRSRNIDVSKLFKGERIKRKNSAVIANDLVSFWQSRITSRRFMDDFSGEGLVDEIALSNLISCIISTAQSVELMERIEEQIAKYVDVLSTSNINQDLVADMIATSISDYVIDFGFHYLTKEQVETSRRVAAEQHLACFDWIERPRQECYDEDGMTALFNSILDSESMHTPAYMASYNRWLEYMFVAFIAHLNVPDYDREANAELKVILDELKK